MFTFPFSLSLSLSLSLTLTQVPLSVPSQPTTPRSQQEQPPAASNVNIENGVEALSLEDTPQVSTLPDSLMPAPSTVVRSSPQKQPLSADMGHPPLEGTPQSQSTFPQQAVPPHGSSISTGTFPQTQPALHQISLSSNVPTFHPGATGPPHPPQQQQQQQQQQLSAMYGVPPPAATQLTTLPGASTIPHSTPVSGGHGYSQATPSIQATPSYGVPQMTGVYPSATSQATLSGLPPLPPTISLPSVAPTISLGPAPNLMSTANTAQ